MTTEGRTFEQWLEAAEVSAERLSDERRALLRCVFRFLQQAKGDYSSSRIAGYFLLRCGADLKVAARDPLVVLHQQQHEQIGCIQIDLHPACRHTFLGFGTASVGSYDKVNRTHGSVQQRLAKARRDLAQGIELVEIQADQQLFGKGLLDGPIKGGQPSLAKLVVRAHLGIAKRMQVDADMGKPGLLDQREVPLLKA